MQFKFATQDDSTSMLDFFRESLSSTEYEAEYCDSGLCSLLDHCNYNNFR